MHERAGDQLTERRGLVGVGQTVGGILDLLQRRDLEIGVAACAQDIEQIILAPHDALGHPGGAAGIEQEQIVAAAPPRAHGARACLSRQGSVILGPIGRLKACFGRADPEFDLA